MRDRKRLPLMAFSISLAFLLMGNISLADEVKRMTKEELKAILDSPDLVLLDVRSGRDWSASQIKIKGALRKDMQEVNEWAPKYDKENPVVLYCA